MSDIPMVHTFTEHEVLVNAICDLDPKGDSEILSKALYIISLADEKEYTSSTKLFEDALKKWSEYYNE